MDFTAHFVFLIVVTFQVLVNVSSFGSADSVQPEFAEPIKNITISEGSNVELSCSVKNLGSYRIMWLKKEGRKETFVAINLLKITKNSRLSVTLMQTSDDITQSTVYIRNIEKEDYAVYECAINTNPMISQTGTLEFPTLDLPASIENPGTTNSSIYSNDKEMKNLTNSESSNYEEVLELNQDVKNGTDSGCSEMQSYWEEATDSIKEMLKNVLTSLVNFTCSFFTPNQ